MAKLFKNLILFSIFSVLILEVLLRISGYASDRLTLELDSNGFVIFTPGQEGYRSRGMRGEVRALYNINKSGWNSIIDYVEVDTNTVAIIGDSYIASFWNGVDKSIGRQLENYLLDRGRYVTVHEYGRPGANFYDYLNLINYLKKTGYRNIFVFFGKKDFKAKKASFTNKVKFQDLQGLKSLYIQSALLRYININFDIKNIFKRNSKIVNKKEELNILDDFNKRAKDGVVYFYEDGFFDSLNSIHSVIKINHIVQPIDHGFNGHWNVNGNYNVAVTLGNYLLENSK